MDEIERTIREFIPHRDADYIPDLVKAINKIIREIENKAFNEGCSFEADASGRERCDI